MRPDAALFLGFIWSQFVATIWQRQQCSTNDPPRPLDSRRRPLYRPPMPTPGPEPAPEYIQIGRRSCRESGGQNVEINVVEGVLHKKIHIIDTINTNKIT